MYDHRHHRHGSFTTTQSHCTVNWRHTVWHINSVTSWHISWAPAVSFDNIEQHLQQYPTDITDITVIVIIKIAVADAGRYTNVDSADGAVPSWSMCSLLFLRPPYWPMNDPSSLNLDGSGSSYSPRLSVSLSRGFSSLLSDVWLFLCGCGSSLDTHQTNVQWLSYYTNFSTKETVD